MIYVNDVGIDWEKETPKVREAMELMIRAYNLHESFTPEEEQRFDFLTESILGPKEEETSKP